VTTNDEEQQRMTGGGQYQNIEGGTSTRRAQEGNETESSKMKVSSARKCGAGREWPVRAQPRYPPYNIESLSILHEKNTSHSRKDNTLGHNCVLKVLSENHERQIY
jgi:hypothetical protein